MHRCGSTGSPRAVPDARRELRLCRESDAIGPVEGLASASLENGPVCRGHFGSQPASCLLYTTVGKKSIAMYPSKCSELRGRAGLEPA
jgi:hypothetical protein